MALQPSGACAARSTAFAPEAPLTFPNGVRQVKMAALTKARRRVVPSLWEYALILW